MSYAEFLISKDPLYEYYCHDCQQLRLDTSGNRPKQCENCGSADIEIELAPNERLHKLRHKRR